MSKAKVNSEKIIHRCESCGPTLEKVYWHDGTWWCNACMQTEGWPLVEEPE